MYGTKQTLDINIFLQETSTKKGMQRKCRNSSKDRNFETIGRFDIWGVIHCVRSTHNNTRNYTIIAPFLCSYCCRVFGFCFHYYCISSRGLTHERKQFFFLLIFLQAHARATSSLFPKRILYINICQNMYVLQYALHGTIIVVDN